MFRQAIRCEVRYGHFAEFVDLCDEINGLCSKAGIAPARVLISSYGKGNVVVIETEYDTLDAMKAEEKAFYGNAEIMKAVRRQADLVIEGSLFTELLEPAPHLA